MPLKFKRFVRQSPKKGALPCAFCAQRSDTTAAYSKGLSSAFITRHSSPTPGASHHSRTLVAPLLWSQRTVSATVLRHFSSAGELEKETRCRSDFTRSDLQS